MAEQSTKNFIKGSAKARPTQFGEIISLSLNLEQLNQLPTDKGYIRLTVMKKREIDTYGNTHYIIEDTYKSSSSGNGASQSNNSDANAAKGGPVDEDLPF